MQKKQICAVVCRILVSAQGDITSRSKLHSGCCAVSSNAIPVCPWCHNVAVHSKRLGEVTDCLPESRECSALYWHLWLPQINYWHARRKAGRNLIRWSSLVHINEPTRGTYSVNSNFSQQLSEHNARGPIFIIDCMYSHADPNHYHIHCFHLTLATGSKPTWKA